MSASHACAMFLRDVEQHIKSCGSRRVAKRDSDGWLVVSVGLFSERGTSTCLLGNVSTVL